jgi:hypothetical protein
MKETCLYYAIAFADLNMIEQHDKNENLPNLQGTERGAQLFIVHFVTYHMMNIPCRGYPCSYCCS